MNMQLVQKVGKKFMKKVPVIKAGSTVKVHQRIKEGSKERIQIFEGLVIAVNSGSGPDKTFTVRKVVGGIGVEKIFPLYSTNITKIQVTKSSDVRRSKLYYMRKRSGKSARLKEKHLTEKDVEMEEIEGIGQEEAANEEVVEETAAPEVAAEATPEEASTEVPAETAEEPVKEEVAEEAAPAEEVKEEAAAPAEEPAEEKKEDKAE
jgi:large subunit ribosomal protein L19